MIQLYFDSYKSSTDWPYIYILFSHSLTKWTFKNKYEINTSMKKASYDDIWTWDIKQQQRNAIHSFFNMQLKVGRGRGPLAWRLENAHITLKMFKNRYPFLYNSSAFLLFPFCITQSHHADFVLSWNFIPRAIFTFLCPDSILLYKGKMAIDMRLFILIRIISFW